MDSFGVSVSPGPDSQGLHNAAVKPCPQASEYTEDGEEQRAGLEIREV